MCSLNILIELPKQRLGLGFPNTDVYCTVFITHCYAEFFGPYNWMCTFGTIGECVSQHNTEHTIEKYTLYLHHQQLL